MAELAPALARALDTGRFDGLPAPASRRDRLAALGLLQELQLAPLSTAEALRRSAFAADPDVAATTHRLQAAWLDELAADAPLGEERDPEAVVKAMRSIAATDRLPPVYRWLASDASYDELVSFLALEGGPDADFDDLVAACQIGLTGRAKGELAQNYWDEMGDGDSEQVHTVLHDRMVAALDIRALPDSQLPTEALARRAFGGLLATNHHLQPEMLGALGLTELQAGPRCRLVLKAFDRLGVPAAAYPFYEVHADVDPRHGRDWLDNAIVPIVSERPEWGPRIVRGTRWRKLVDDAFFVWADGAMARPLAA